MQPIVGSLKQLRAILVCVAPLLVAAEAAAERRAPAPISYGSATGQASRPAVVTSTRSTTRETPSVSKRVDFRYPDQTGRDYGTVTPDDSAVDQFRRRNYSTTGTTQPAPTPVSTSTRTTTPVYRPTPAPSGNGTARTTPVDQSGLPPVSRPAPILVPPRSGSGAVTMPDYNEFGSVIVYEPDYEGLPTASGEVYDPNAMTAAHPTLPLPSLVHVLNEATGKEVVVRVNDRGPFEAGAVLQVSPRAAGLLGLGGTGQGSVKLRYLGPAPSATPGRSTSPSSAPGYRVTPVSVPQDLPQPARPAPVVTTPAPVRTVYTPQADGNFFVQVGAFSDISNAERVSDELAASMTVEIQSANVNGADWFRVRVGPVSSRESAEVLKSRLASEGFPAARVVTAG